MTDSRRAAGFAALVVLAAGLATMTPHLIGVFFDDAIYALQAKALAEGQGFVYAQLPGTPPAIHYPPAWPLLLAAVWKITPEFPGNVAWLKMLNPLLLALAAALVLRVGERLFGLRPLLAAGIVLVSMVSVPVLLLGNVLMSEPLFLLCFAATVLLAATWQERRDTRSLAMLALATGLLLMVRTIGGVIAIAVLMTLLLERRWLPALLYTAVVALVLAPWQWFVWQHAEAFPELLRGSYGPYLEWVVQGYRDGGTAFLVDVTQKNVVDAWRSSGAMLTPFLPGAPRIAALGVLVLLVAIGLLRGLAEPKQRVLALALGGYLVVILAWPFQVERFLWALWPMLALFTLSGARWLAALAAARGASLTMQRVPLALAALLGLGHLVYNARGIARGWTGSAAGQMSARAERLVRYINSDPRLAGLTIGTEADPVVALYTGHQVVPMEVLRPEDHLREKTVAERAVEVARFDREFRPDAYVMMPEGVHLPALLAATLDSTRVLREITPPGGTIRSFLVQTR